MTVLSDKFLEDPSVLGEDIWKARSLTAHLVTFCYHLSPCSNQQGSAEDRRLCSRLFRLLFFYVINIKQKQCSGVFILFKMICNRRIRINNRLRKK